MLAEATTHSNGVENGSSVVVLKGVQIVGLSGCMHQRGIHSRTGDRPTFATLYGALPVLLVLTILGPFRTLVLIAEGALEESSLPGVASGVP